MAVEGDFIKFMGTAGARYVVSRQLRYSAGTWCSFQGCNICIDPGPGTLVRCFASRPPLDPSTLDALVLTHRHLDHANDINIMIEAMTEATHKKKGAVYLPGDAVRGEDPVVFRYLRRCYEQQVILVEQGTYALAEGVRMSTPVRHDHGVETYGLLFELPRAKVAFIADTGYFAGLEKHYAADLLVLNVVLYKHPGVRGIQHLDLEAAGKIIDATRPRLAVLTHFGLSMLRAVPHRLALALQQQTGIRVIAATDGMKLSLDGI